VDAEGFSDILQGKRTGPGKWIALCPGHADRKPSLSIRQGDRGVLLRCWSAGCTPAQIVAAMGLTMRALFDGPPATPEQSAELRQQREVHAVMERGLRLRDREARHNLWRLERLRDALGAKLARNPDDAELARLFHEVCDRIRVDTPAIYPQPEDGPNRTSEPMDTPGWAAAALREISQSFFAQNNEKAARQAA
jgi:hypothetical protein